MSKTMKTLIALKLALIAAGAGAYYYYTKYYHKDDKVAKVEKPVEADAMLNDIQEAKDVPELPKGEMVLSTAVKLREQLEFMRQDVLAKVAKLHAAKEAYDKAKSDVDEKLKKTEEERKLLEETLQKEKQAKSDRLEKALKVVGKMDPKKAAPMIEGMDRDLVIALLKSLPENQVTKILEGVSPKKASEFLEYYTKIRSGREYELMKELGLCLTEPPGQSEQSLNVTGAGNPASSSQTPAPQSNPQSQPNAAPAPQASPVATP